jgi:hypothetical protein
MESQQDPPTSAMVQRGSETTSTRDISSRHKNNVEVIEKSLDTPATKLEENSSAESLQKLRTIEEVPAGDDNEYEPGLITRYWYKFRPLWHLGIWLLVTA